MQCPICSLSFPRKDIVEHVQIHFENDDAQQPETHPEARQEALGAPEQHRQERQDEDFDGMAIVCPICSADVPLADVERHEQGHHREQQQQRDAQMREAGEEEEETVQCSVCPAFVRLSDLESHEAAHRLDAASGEGPPEAEPFAASHRSIGNGSGNGNGNGSGNGTGNGIGGSGDSGSSGAGQSVCGLPRLRGHRTLHMAPAQGPPVPGGIMGLLKRALDESSGDGRPRGSVLLAGEATHFHTDRTDMGWGCGWRNLQIMVSHLLGRREDFRAALFDGCGFVPDVSSLQGWLELAWDNGYDPEGCHQLGGSIKGTKKWVGATDCVAVLRSCGARAEVVDFHTAQQQQSGQGTWGQGGGHHPGVECDGCGMFPMTGTRYRSERLSNFDLCSACKSGPLKDKGPFDAIPPPCPPRFRAGTQEASAENWNLVDWVWRYFNDEDLQATGSPAVASAAALRSEEEDEDEAGSSRKRPAADAFSVMLRASAARGNARVTGKPPLLFQHQGHSRTIVGIEKLPGSQASRDYTLILLDPSDTTSRLVNQLSASGASASRGRSGQPEVPSSCRLRGDRLTKDKYQIMFVDTSRGLVDGRAEQMERRLIRPFQRFGS